jgi:two-component system, NtrC family, response regulator HydG
MKILVIDDDGCQLQWCSSNLEKRGYEVETAFSGEHGLHIYQTRDPWEFVLSDYLFVPSRRIRNGLDLVREIRAINPDQRIAIHTSAEDLQALVPVLRKPYPFEKLLRLFRQPLMSLAAPRRDLRPK